MKKFLALFLVLLLLVPIAAACGGSGELRHITLNEVTRSVFYAPLYIAFSRGYFAEEGIDIEIVTGGGSDKSMTALISGDADFALMGPETGVYVVNEGSANHPMIIGPLTKRDG